MASHARTLERRTRGKRVSYSIAEISDVETSEDAQSDFEHMSGNESQDEDEDQIMDDSDDDDRVSELGPGRRSAPVVELDGSVDSDDDLDDKPAKKKRKTENATLRKPKSKKNKKPEISKKALGSVISGRDLQLELPPLTDINDIFLDITKKAEKQGLSKAIDHLKGIKLKVGTMCSGTESPLLALGLVQQSLPKLGIADLDVDHVFSAEIVAFKQAYIERNFHPNLLFRDITELYLDEKKQMRGTTAYGAEVDVPKHIHILIAGSSCVDFSTLNTAQVDGFGQRKGESEDTFLAVWRYTKWARPPIVILENVDQQEAWDEFEAHFEQIGYATEVFKVDTKDYYIPHTRQRRYMLCLDQELYREAQNVELPAWRKTMVGFERRASSALPSFLLPADDPRHISLMHRDQGSSREGKVEKSWEACRGRHLAARSVEALGVRKPITTVLPEHCDWGFMMRRVPREWDVVDICHLRQGLKGNDSQFKTRVIDLSQK